MNVMLSLCYLLGMGICLGGAAGLVRRMQASRTGRGATLRSAMTVLAGATMLVGACAWQSIEAASLGGDTYLVAADAAPPSPASAPPAKASPLRLGTDAMPPLSPQARAAYEQAKAIRTAVGKLMLQRGSDDSAGITTAALVASKLLPPDMVTPDGGIAPAAGKHVEVEPGTAPHSFWVRFNGLLPEDCSALVANTAGASVVHTCPLGLLSWQLVPERAVSEAIAARRAAPPAAPPPLSRTATAVHKQAQVLHQAVDSLYGKEADDYRGLSASALIRARLLPAEMQATGLEVIPAAGTSVSVEPGPSGTGYGIRFSGLDAGDCRALVANTVGAGVVDGCATGTLTWTFGPKPGR